MIRPVSRYLVISSVFFVLSCTLVGCGGPDNTPIPEAEQQQQIQQLNQQRADEWGNKAK